MRRDEDPGANIQSAVETFIAEKAIPGLALTVVKDGHPVHVACFGLANVELGVPVHAGSVFELASLTKHMTALAIWRLVADGQIAPDSRLSDFVSGAPDHWRGICISHLLNHAAGLQNRFEGNVGQRYFLDYTKEDLIADAKALHPLAAPGERFEYSDQGYFLLACILERVTGASYGEFMQTRFFDPLGMSHTTIHSKRKLIFDRVAGYTLEHGKLINIRRDSEQEAQGHFGVMSTIDDMLTWENALHKGSLVPSSQRKRFDSLRQLIAAGDDYTTEYASGWFVTEYQGRHLAEHTGMTGNAYLRDLDTGLSVLLLTNQAHGSSIELLGRKIAGICDPSFPTVGNN